MAKVTVNANKLIECGEEIVNLSEEYNDLINNLFDKLSKIPQTCWTGESANQYVSIVSKDRNIYTGFGKGLITYGNAIKAAGNNLNYVAKKWSDK